MRRIILHWTAGAGRAGAEDRKHYHFIVEEDGKVVAGVHKPEANAASKLVSGRYAAHTLNCNSGSIGISVAAMRGAQERPFTTGPSPITHQQIDALVALAADLCRRYGITPNRTTVLTHAEVQGTLGIRQNGKWDITWLPGFSGPRPAAEVGAVLRMRIAAALQAGSAPVTSARPPAKPATPAPAPAPRPTAKPAAIPFSFGAWIASGLSALAALLKPSG